jgi:hypothetical protein
LESQRNLRFSEELPKLRVAGGLLLSGGELAPVSTLAMMPVTWAMVPRWVVMQPLGRPVVPEV